MNEITADASLVARCGLYCGSCRSYRKRRCPGCHENTKAGWCTVRSCCAEQGYSSCAECEQFEDPSECGKFNNVFSKVIGLVLNSNRRACILDIRERGLEGYAEHMAEKGLQTLPRR